MRSLRSGALAVLSGLAMAAPAGAAEDESRFALVNGCYALQSGDRLVAKGAGAYRVSATAPAGAERFRMQATDLGVYLLYDRDAEFLAAGAQGAESATEPSPAAEWRVEVAPDGMTLTDLRSGEGLHAGEDGALESGEPTAFRFVEAEGCATYPELGTDTTGEAATRALFAPTRGLLDAHLHAMAFPFLGGGVHCGRPWHRYGAPYALRDCPEHEPNGEAAIVENIASYGTPVGQHETDGWPTFKGWPNHRSLTHEQVYWKWLERAWLGGVRMVVNLYVDNGVLCEVYPVRKTTCNEMDNVRLQIRHMREFVDYVDAQYGGPGKGFVRIVTDPFEARRVINGGKLAVVQGIEISRLFGCTETNDVPECSRRDIDAQLEEMYDAGIRQMELINKFDNALTGVAGDGGTNGVITNSGNRYETGHYIAMQTCTGDEHVHDNAQVTLPGTEDTDPLVGATLQAFLGPDTVPVYPPPPHCNIRGLTDLGAYVIRQMIERGMIFDPDHMSVLGRRQAMDLIEAHRYPGVVSSHSWSTPDAYARIAALGGVITPAEKPADSFVKAWREMKSISNPRMLYGIGFSTDMNGFASQARPRREGPEFSYPFTSLDGAVRLDRQKSGEKTFDISVDGLAHYGLYPDMIEDLRLVGGKEIARDLLRGAEAYLQMWERAVGVPFGCQSDRERVTRNGRAGLRLGFTAERALRSAGQPDVRRTRVWRYCIQGTRNRGERVVGVLTRRGRVALVADTGATAQANGIHRGDPASRLRGRARRIGKRVVARRGRDGKVFVYGLRRGRVRYVAVASRAAGKSRARLRAYVERAGL